MGVPSAKGGNDIEGEGEAPSDVDSMLMDMQLKDEELYHVAADRREKSEVAKDKPEVASELKDKLVVFQGKYNWKFGHDVGERVQKEVDPELKEKLEAMGYVL